MRRRFNDPRVPKKVQFPAGGDPSAFYEHVVKQFETLDHREIRMMWVAQPDACKKCRQLADGSPYDVGTLTSWPGTPISTCGDRCRCLIKANEEDWQRRFGNRPRE